jgi:DNA replication licensing factor MCM2
LSDRLRDLRQGDLNNLIRVSGVVTRRTSVFPQLKAVAYDCKSCGQILGPFQITGAEIRPTACISCQSQGPFAINNQKSEYGNYQKITLQESPGSVPAGRVPRYKDVILLGDLIDIARPGEEIEVTGIYEHSQVGVSRDRSGFPVFSTVIQVSYCIIYPL